MSAPKRSTICFDPELHSGRQTLSEDATDLEVFEKRRQEQELDFEEVVAKLERSGKL